MQQGAARWIVVASIGVVGVALIGDVALLGLIPLVVIGAVATLQFVVDKPEGGPAEHVRAQVRRQLLAGSADEAARLVIPMLNSRSAGTRRFGATMMAIAVQAGADDPAVLDTIPRLRDLAPTYRVARALRVHGRHADAIEVLSGATDMHDPVAWAEYVGALAATGDDDKLRGTIMSATTAIPVEAVVLASRGLTTGQTMALRNALEVKLSESAPAVMVLDARLDDASEALTRFVAAHSATTDGNLAAWVAWAATVLGSPVAVEHLDRIVGQSASGQTSVALMMASIHGGRPDIALRVARSAIRSARSDVRAALQLANAQALAVAGRPDDAIAALYLVPTEMSLVAAITPPLAPSIHEAAGYTSLVDHIVAN